MECLMMKLNEMRLQGDMCDVNIMTKDGTKHPVHSVVIAAASPVFKVMVTKDFLELQSKLIRLHDVADDLLTCVLDFIYTGNLNMTNENALELFMVADQFEIKSLFYTCTEYIIDHVDVSNCLGIFRIAERYNNENLCKYSATFMLQNFQEFTQKDDYLDISLDELIQLLLHDQLNVEKEEHLLEIIFKWVDHSPKERSQDLEKMLHCLRFPLMDYGFIEGKFRRYSRWKYNKSLQKLVKTIYNKCTELISQKHNNSNNNSNNSNNNNKNNNAKENKECVKNLEWMSTRHRLPNKLIFVFGGWCRGRTLDVTECYNLKTEQWYVTNHLKDDTEGRSYFDAEIVQNKVYIVGGYNGRTYLNSIRIFDPVSKEWSSAPPMNHRRCFTSAVNINGELYVIAGFDGTRRLSTCEKYTPHTKEWMMLKSLNTPRSDGAVVVHNGGIYIFGGFSGDSLCSAEHYNVEEDKWEHVAQMQSKRSGASAISLPEENKIFVLGGYDGHSRTLTTEYYDPVTNTWRYGPNMKKGRSNFATCVIGNELHIIGGYTGTLTLKDVEVFDLKNEVWCEGSKLNCGRSAMKAVLLENVWNSDEYFDMDDEEYEMDESQLYNEMLNELNQRSTNGIYDNSVNSFRFL